MNDDTRSRVGFVYVEIDGTYVLRPLDMIKPGDITKWGQFRGITLDNEVFYFTFLKQSWNERTEAYEGSESKVAIKAIVHPRTTINHGVIVEPFSFVAEGVELLSGAHVKTRQVISSGRFHHLKSSVAG